MNRNNQQLKGWLRRIHEKSSRWEDASDQFVSWFLAEKAFFNIAYDILGSAEDAEDVLQDVLTKLAVEGVEPPTGEVLNWCCRIVHHRSIDALRKRQSRPQELDSDELLPNVPDGQSTPPDRAAYRAELRDILTEAEEKALTPDQRQIIQLSEAGHSNTDIAETLGVSSKSVEQNKWRAKQKLKEYLLKHHPEYVSEFLPPTVDNRSEPD
jgi:RNA polymerase sigma factor (sigma-70 family)